nr:PREDICTED: uncharacterized protein LOC105678999 isoform X2 [Linepithema humile]
MSEIIITKDNLWKYFERITEEKFRANCKKCGESFTYITDTAFLAHLRTKKHQKYFVDEANKNLEEEPYIYYDQLKQQCEVCDKNVLYERFEAHVQDHFEEEMAYYEARRTIKEHMIQHDNFEAKCGVENCDDIILLQIIPPLIYHLESKHRNELEYIQKDATRVPTKVTNREELLQNYTLHTEYFHAKCNFCNYKEYYVDTVKFHEHLKNDHNEVYSYENAKKGFPWEHFKYYDEDNLQCLLCRNLHTEVFMLEWLTDHIYSYHNRTYYATLHNRNSSDMTWKYIDISGDFQVRCRLCSAENKLDINFTKLNDHIVKTHLKEPPSTKSRYDKIAEASESPQKKKVRKKM